MRPVVCLITDGRCTDEAAAAALVARIGAAAHAGVHLIQIREPQLEARRLTALVEAAVSIVRGSRARVLVNDRLDVARAAGAHGVHLRSASIPAMRVRPHVPPGFLIGRSVHGTREAMAVARDGALDYLIFGTVFETTSKPGLAASGLAALAAAAASVSLPVLGVGGMVPDRLADVRAAGAAGFAAVGLFAGTPVDRLQIAVQQASMAFDTPSHVP